MDRSLASSTLSSDITIVLVPFFGGRKPSLQRHLDYFQDLGFKTQFVDLPFKPIDTKTLSQNLVSLPDTSTDLQVSIGLRPIWTKKISQTLNAIAGPKIVFAMSNPSSAAIEAISNRNAHDILGLICDGGPSSSLMASLLNYYKFEQPIGNYLVRYGYATLAKWLIDQSFDLQVQNNLKKMPKGFRILSIRGWKDPLISPQMIDQVFEAHAQLDWEKLSLPEAAHLNGLKDFGSEYKPGIERFIKSLF